MRVLRFRWGRLRRRCGDRVAAIDEAIVGAAPWRWRTRRLNRRDDQIEDRSSSGTVDEGRRGVAVDDIVGKRLRLGSGDVADGGGWGFAAGAERLWRPGISNGEKDLIGGGNHDLGMRLSKMEVVLQKYPTDLN